MSEQPEGFIEAQSQTDRPFDDDDTIMDDTVALMDDPSALMGGVVTLNPNISLSGTVTKPQGK